MPRVRLGKVMHDVLKWECHPAFCRLAGVAIKNDLGSAWTIEDPVGLAVKEAAGVWTPALETQESSIDGILIRGPEIGQGFNALASNASTAAGCVILVTGPALVNFDMIKDAHGYPFVEADLIARLAALDIKVLFEPDVSATQLT